LVLIWLNKAVKLLSILINPLWTHRCSAFTKDLAVIKIQYKSNKKQKMGTYAVNIYGWLMCKLTVPQRTIESKTNMQYIFKIICILQSLYIPILMLCLSSLWQFRTGGLWYLTLTWFVLLYSVYAIRKHIAHDNVPRYNHRLRALLMRLIFMDD
jgi:hypothetical protein